jgi:hypothetical protein
MNQLDPQIQPDPAQAAAMRQALFMSEAARLGRVANGGISNFYWIAALSTINTVIDLFNGSIHFVIGLGLTQLIDAFASEFVKQLPEIAIAFRGVQLVLDFILIGLFALFGFLGLKGKRWAVVTGMVLYALDALLMLLFKDWLGFGFHLFFLWGLWSGLRAADQLRKHLATANSTPQTGFPANIG